MMETNDDRIAALENDLRGIKKSFEVLLLAIEADGVVAASEIAERLMSRLETLMAQVKTTYVEIVFEGRARSLADDHQRLVDARNGGRPSPDAFIELVGRIERHIANADREMRLLAPRRNEAQRWLIHNWKKVAIAAGALLVAASAGTFLRDFMTRGKGLTGEYYDGTNFRKLLKTHRDLRIDFELNGKSPVRGVGVDNFSVRWTGMLRVPTDGDYEFLTRSDDGVRLWIDGQQMIDNWTVHRPALDKAIKTLAAGNHPIRLEWFQRRGPSMLKLYWRTANDAEPRIIDGEYLIPNQG